MKLSRNNIYIPINSDDYLIANTYTRAVVSLHKNILAMLQKRDKENVNNIDNNILNVLIEKNIVVPHDLDEDSSVEYLFWRQQLNDNCLVTYLMYSTKCNFACEYCYEKGHTNSTTMDDKTTNDLIEWYKYKMMYGGVKECKIILFGGEPLLYKKAFLEILSSVKQIATVNAVKLTTEIITNGFYLDNEFMQEMRHYNLKEVQITIDGLPLYHDKLRHLKNGKGTFNRVFSNLLSVSSQYANNVVFLCRISFSKANIDNILSFVDFLHDNDPQHHITPYFAHITQTFTQNSDFSSFCSGNVFSDDEELADIYAMLWKKAKEKGYNIPSFHTLGPCMYHSANGYVITPEGNLYKCLDMVGIKEHISGNIENPIWNNTYYYKTVCSSQIKYCLKTDCPYVPICSNGCILEAWLKHGSSQKICCKRRFLDKVTSKLLITKYTEKTI